MLFNSKKTLKFKKITKAFKKIIKGIQKNLINPLFG